jgi:hypothetical protein
VSKFWVGHEQFIGFLFSVSTHLWRADGYLVLVVSARGVRTIGTQLLVVISDRHPHPHHRNGRRMCSRLDDVEMEVSLLLSMALDLLCSGQFYDRR